MDDNSHFNTRAVEVLAEGNVELMNIGINNDANPKSPTFGNPNANKGDEIQRIEQSGETKKERLVDYDSYLDSMFESVAPKTRSASAKQVAFEQQQQQHQGENSVVTRNPETPKSDVATAVAQEQENVEQMLPKDEPGQTGDEGEGAQHEFQ